MEEKSLKRCEILELELRNLQDRLSHLEVRLSDGEGGSKTLAPTSPAVERVSPEEVDPTDPTEKEDPGIPGMLDVHLDESIWSIAVVVGLEHSLFTGFFQSFVSALLAMVTASTQVIFIIVLLSNILLPFQDQVSGARAWRTLVAHDAQNRDLSGISLATRACNDYSGFMGSIIEEIDLYLGLDPKSFEMPAFVPGTFLCVLCILVWSLCVLKELRSYWLMVQVLFFLPRSPLSSVGETVSLSCTRLWTLMSLYALRTSISLLLLLGGILLLSTTTSLVQMILITAALPVILNIDKQFFSAVMPMEIKSGIQRFKPFRIHYSHIHSQIETFVAAFLVMTVLLVSDRLLLGPIAQKKLDTKFELCGGQQAFAVAHNPDTQLTFAITNGAAVGAVQAVEEYKFSSSSALPSSMVFTTEELFETQSLRGMKEEATLAPCWEEGNVSNTSLQTAALNAAALALGSSASTCEALAAKCHEGSGRLLRMACGVTCGCSEPQTSPWYKVEAQGCASSCLASASAKAAQMPCQDVDKTSSAWQDFCEEYIPAVSNILKARDNDNLAGLQQAVQTMKSEGCPFLLQEPFETATGARWCVGHDDLFRPLRYLCPASCAVCL